MKYILAITLLLIRSFCSISQDLFVDSSFASNGILSYNSAFVSDIAVQNDGKLLFLKRDPSGYPLDDLLGRLLTDGRLDGSFQSLLGIQYSSDLTYSAAGIYGVFLGSVYGYSGYKLITKFTENGSLDQGFGTNGQLVQFQNQQYNKFTVTDQGIIYRPAMFYGAFFVEKYFPNGDRDWSYGPSGYPVSSDNSFTSILAQPDGKVVVGSLDVGWYGFNNSWLRRLDPTGNIDNSFGNNGELALPASDALTEPIQIERLRNGAYLVLLHRSRSYDSTDIDMIRVDERGVIDPNFGNNGLLRLQRLQPQVERPAFVLLSNGKILYPSIRLGANNNYEIVFTSYLPNGTIDNRFGNAGVKTFVLPSGFSAIREIAYKNGDLFVVGYQNDNFGTGAILNFKVTDNSNNCPTDIVVYTSPTGCSKQVLGIDPIIGTNDFSGVGYVLTGATNQSGTGTVSGKTFNLGNTLVRYYSLTDTTRECYFSVIVRDTSGPVFVKASANRDVIFPADHNMKDIFLTYEIADSCGYTTSLAVESNEEILSSAWPLDQYPDWFILSPTHVRVRAEFLPWGNGRTYTISATATDGSGNVSRKLLEIYVPKGNETPSPNLRVFVNPNPSAGNFTIRVEADDPFSPIHLRLVNEQGVLVGEIKNYTSGQTLSYGASLRRGTYYLEARQGASQRIATLIKL